MKQLRGAYGTVVMDSRDDSRVVVARSGSPLVIGRGIGEMPLPGIGHRVALPNIVLPAGTAAHGRPHPINLGAIDIAWPQRARLAGTHDQRWLEEDFRKDGTSIKWVFSAGSNRALEYLIAQAQKQDIWPSADYFRQ